MNVLGRLFSNSRKVRRKDVKTEFFLVRCRRTFILKNRNLGRVKVSQLCNYQGYSIY